jgi:hypothetical protein
MSSLASWVTCAWAWTTDHATVLSAVVTAAATVVVALFTWMLSKTTKLARNEFISTHRPKIRVRAFRLHSEDRTQMQTAEHKYLIEFIYFNEGNTGAYIKQIRTRLIAGENPWTYGDKRIHFDDVTPSADKLMTGEERMYLTKAVFNWDEKDENWFCVEDIEYRDEQGLKRKTGFCRRWNPKTMNWDREENDELEYAY